jgi:outer membrane protein assembly factor BamB
MTALDAKTGKLIWKAATGGWVWSTPVIADNSVYFGDQDGTLFSLDAASGAVRWQIKPDQAENRAITSTPVIVGDTLYFASNAGILYAVDLATGTPRWNKTIGGKIYSNLVLSGETILITPSEFDSTLVAVDLQGNTRWSYAPAKKS